MTAHFPGIRLYIKTKTLQMDRLYLKIVMYFPVIYNPNALTAFKKKYLMDHSIVLDLSIWLMYKYFIVYII